MSDEGYYARREREERALASSAKTPEIRAIHQTLADKYAELAMPEVWPLNDEPEIRQASQA